MCVCCLAACILGMYCIELVVEGPTKSPFYLHSSCVCVCVFVVVSNGFEPDDP